MWTPRIQLLSQTTAVCSRAPSHNQETECGLRLGAHPSNDCHPKTEAARPPSPLVGILLNSHLGGVGEGEPVQKWAEIITPRMLVSAGVTESEEDVQQKTVRQPF